MLPKPLYAEPCNGCGECCRMAPCPAIQILHPLILHPLEATAPCPRIRQELDGSVRCGLFQDETDPTRKEFISLAAGIVNWGCDSVANEADREIRYRLGAPRFEEDEAERAKVLFPMFVPKNFRPWRRPNR